MIKYKLYSIPIFELRSDSSKISGMSLMELLVAFTIFVMLISILVGFLFTGLGFWSTGEKRKDVYDRSQVILEQISEDIRNTFADADLRFTSVPAYFVCDIDRNKNQRLRFVRNGDASKLRVNIPRNLPAVPQRYYTDLFEVCYVMDSDAGKDILWRGIRYFDRNTQQGSIFSRDIDDLTSLLWRNNFTKIGDGVLYVGYKFWTQYTNTWDTKYKIKKPERGRREQIGPEVIWDSSRRTFLRDFFFFKDVFDARRPDFVYPKIVQVTLVVEPFVVGYRGSHLVEAMQENGSRIVVENPKELPDAPSFIKIEKEWIEYKEKSGSVLTVSNRGVRGTRAVSHKVGSPVKFGETFTLEVYLPAYRISEDE